MRSMNCSPQDQVYERFASSMDGTYLSTEPSNLWNTSGPFCRNAISDSDRFDDSAIAAWDGLPKQAGLYSGFAPKPAQYSIRDVSVSAEETYQCRRDQQ